MTRNAAIREYCRAVGKSLDIPGQRKKELLSGLRQELEERFLDSEVLTMERLAGEAGTVDETADALMDGMPPGELGLYRARQKQLTRLIIAGLALLLTASVVLFIYAEKSQVARTEQTIIVHPTIYEGEGKE